MSDNINVEGREDGSFLITSSRGLLVVARDRHELERVRGGLRENLKALFTAEQALTSFLEGE